METPEELSDITDGDGCSRARTESGWTSYLLSSMHDADDDSDGKSSLASDASTGNINHGHANDKMMHFHNYDDYNYDDGDDYPKGKVEKPPSMEKEKNTEKKWFRGFFKKDHASSSKGSGSKSKKLSKLQ